MFYISAGGNQIYKPLDDLLMLFSPKLTLEIGKAGSLEFDIPPNNPYYDRLNQLTTEVTVDMDSEEIFHGRVLSVERSFNNIRHVYCEGDLSYLIDSVQKGVRYSGTTHDLFSRIISNHNARVDANKRFTVGIVNIENRSIILVGHSDDENVNTGEVDYKQIAIDSIVDEWNNSFDYIQTCLIDYCGGYLRTRRANGTTYIDLLDNFGNDATQPIELGRNLLDLSEEVSVEDVFTVLIPLGDDNLTIASVNGGSDELVDAGAVRRFGRIVRTHVFNNVSSAATLLENARHYLATSINVPRTITVRAVDLHLINKTIPAIKLGDRVQIASYVHDVNDILTCTKIEYDLEKPENNNYTFGNPKQTLTQRYREDERYSNDTYGNSAISPTAAQSVGKATAASVGAMGAAAGAAQEKALDAFYETWIKDGEEPGKVSLGALYRQFYDGKEVLISQCGIDLDGHTGNVDIRSLHNQVDEYGRTIASNEARIGIVETDTAVAIENMTDRVNQVGDVEAQHHTEITQVCDNLSSRINLLATDINTIDNKTTTSIANISMRADDLESRVTTTAGYISTVDGRETAHYATIQVWANEKESAIALKADKVYVDGLFQAESARIDSLMSGNSTAQHLLANTITASQINLRVGSGTVPLVSTVHSHNITAREGDNGTITISLGSAVTDEIPQQTSFNIADTKYYKDHVAAVDIGSLEPDSYSSVGDYEVVLEDSYVRYSNQQIIGRIRINYSNNDNHKSVVVKISGNRAYEAGANGVTITAITRTRPDGENSYPYYDSPSLGKIIEFKAQASMSNNHGDSVILTVPADAAYNAGYEAGSQGGYGSVNVTSLGLDPNDTVSYSATVNNYYVPVKAVLSNNVTRTTTLTVPATDAYNAGYTAGSSSGAESVYVTGMQHYTISSEQTVSYNSSNNTISASVRATLSNGNTNGSIRTVTFPADLAFDAGAQSIIVSSIGLNTSWATSSTGYIYETANRRFSANIRVRLNNDRAWTNTVYIPAADAYNAGYAAGAAEADTSAVVVETLGLNPNDTVSYSATVKNYYVPIRATLSNANSRNTTITVSGQDAYDHGYGVGETNGANGVTASTIALNTSWSQSSTGYLYQTTNNRYAVNIRVVLSNTKAYTGTVYVSAADAYNRGYTNGEANGINSVTISSIALNTAWSSSSTGYVYQTANKRYAVNIKSTASNNNYSTQTLYIPATDAYNAGAANSVASIVLGDYGSQASVFSYYKQNAAGTLGTIKAEAKDSNGNVLKSADLNVTELIRYVYNSGGGGGSSSVSVRSIRALTNKTYDQNMDMYYVTVRVTYSNGSTQDFQAWYN